MRAVDAARLVALAAIWGGAFVFLRVAAPVLGAVWTSEIRVLLGGLALLAWLRFSGVDVGLRRHARAYFVLGATIIALPFALFAYAAAHAPASLLAIVNATSPMFGIAWSAALGDERLTARRFAGLVLGVAGVALIAGPQDAGAGSPFLLAIAAALCAACAYGATGVLMKRAAGGAAPRGMAAGNQLGAALALLPLLPFALPHAAPSPLVIANVLALALLASGVAFVLYFRLIADIGATRALTVTYLIPLFGVLWGALFLGEAITLSMLGGAALVLLGTFFVLKS